MDFGIALVPYLLLLPLTYLGVVGSIFENGENVEPGKFGRINHCLMENFGRVMLFVYFAALPVFVLGCIVGFFQRRTRDPAKKVMANIVLLLV